VVLVQARVLTEIPYDFKNLCSDINAPALAGKQNAKVLTWLLQATGESSLKLKTSPQHEAACWMLFGDPLRKKVLGNRAAFRQRYALAVFYYATKGPEAWYPDVGNPTRQLRPSKKMDPTFGSANHTNVLGTGFSAPCSYPLLNER